MAYSVKLHLADLRMLFDWLVIGQIGTDLYDRRNDQVSLDEVERIVI